MSTFPGPTLEDYLKWNYDLSVDGASANLSLVLAEMATGSAILDRITTEQFAGLVAIFEPYREDVEAALDGYDYDYSWRDYSAVVDDRVPDDVYDEGFAYLKGLAAESPL